MKHFGKEQSKKKGQWIVVFFMIAGPMFIYYIVDMVVTMHSKESIAMQRATIQALSFGIGSVYHLSLIVCGVLKQAFQVVKERVVEFFENLVVSLGFAIKCYLDSIFHDGISFWLYVGVMAGCAWLSYDGFRDALAIMK